MLTSTSDILSMMSFTKMLNVYVAANYITARQLSMHAVSYTTSLQFVNQFVSKHGYLGEQTELTSFW